MWAGQSPLVESWVLVLALERGQTKLNLTKLVAVQGLGLVQAQALCSFMGSHLGSVSKQKLIRRQSTVRPPDLLQKGLLAEAIALVLPS